MDNEELEVATLAMLDEAKKHFKVSEVEELEQVVWLFMLGEYAYEPQIQEIIDYLGTNSTPNFKEVKVRFCHSDIVKVLQHVVDQYAFKT